MPPALWIKICANTNLEDTLLAAHLGADAVGFVFAPSPRQVKPSQVAAITPHLPVTIEKVGVFIAAAPSDLETIAQSAEHARLTAIQLHGTIDLPFAAALTRRLGPTYKIIHTAHWKLDEDDLSAQRIAAQLATVAAANTPDRILIDAKVRDATGGLGICFNWSKASSVLSSQPQLNIIVAGGLRPENVAEAISALHPYGVDVASGVELAPGRKDPAKLHAFMQKARGAV